MLRLITLFITLLCHLPGTFASEGTILVYGDSISAAYGMDQEQGWVSLLSERLDTEHPGYSVVNASVSGETTGGGLTRLPKSLSLHQPDVLVLELGGNDGLRGYPIEKIRGNLDAMIRQSKEAGTKILLIGMVLPPNYGRRYITAFEKIFTDLADLHQVPFVPFLLNGVATTRDLVQRDGIHPTVEAQPMILEDVYPVLESLLK